MLNVTGLTCAYGELIAVDELTFGVGKGEILGLIGANGAGKTTTIMALAGHITPCAGTISLNDRDITSTRPRERVRSRIALVPEGRRVFADLSVEENLTVGADVLARHAMDGNRARVYETFPRLAERRTQSAGSLSGGEQQMLAIGRAMMADPLVLLVDELSLGLMPKMVEECYAVIAALKEQGITTVLVEQSTQRVLDTADRVLVLETGRKTWEGTGAEAREDPAIIEAYLGTPDKRDG